MNILLDDLPTEYEGYLINYTFRAGILISECLNDENISEAIKIKTVFRILFGKGVPPFEIAMKGLNWFLSGGVKTQTHNGNNSESLFSFVEDRDRIFSAFMVKYGINLNKSNMHFFEFLALFNDLEKTAFKRVVDIRSTKPKDIKHYSKEYKAEVIRLKKTFALKKQTDPKEQEAIDKFNKLLGGN